MLRLHYLEGYIEEAKDLNIPFFFAYPFSSFYDLRKAIDLGVSYVYLDAPIFFQMPEVRKLGIPIRLLPHLANYSTWGFKREKAPYGTWIRPENIDDYEDYAYVVDFCYPPYTHLLPKQEEAYYRIYHDKKAWPGDIQLVIKDIGIPALNRLIPKEELTKRLTCGQKCQMNGICHYCERILDLAAEEEEIRAYKEAKENDELKSIENLENEENEENDNSELV